MSRKKSTKMRGASRPVNPRRAPGQPARRGLDPFAIGLMAVSAIVVAGLVFFLIRPQTGPVNTANVPTTVPGTQATPNTTATTVAFATQVAHLPRISVQEAKALYDSQNAQFIDVRPVEAYTTQHIAGATSIPYTESLPSFANVPKEGNVIVYCQ